MRFKTTFAQETGGGPVDNARAAVDKIAADFADISPAVIVFFAATDYDPDTVAAEMQIAFPGAVTLGCTAAGELRDGKVLSRGVAAMAFSDGVFSFSETAVVIADRDKARETARPDVFSDPDAALKYLARDLGKPLLALDHREYVGFMLADATAPFAESVIERAGELTNVFMVGGIAADDYTFDRQYVFYRGRAYRGGAAVLALWKPANGFELLKTQAVEATGTRFTVTRADEGKRIIREFDGRPALEAYAEAIGVPPENVGIPEFDRNPLALMAEGEPFLCAAVGQAEGGGLQMYTKILEGMRLTLTKSGRIVATTEKVLAGKIAESGEPAAILHVVCAVRHNAMKNVGALDDFGRLFERFPHTAFVSLGEVYVNLVGITSVMILFK